MPDIYADNLVIVMPRGMTLQNWSRVGMLQREWHLLARLAPHFGRLIVVSSDRPLDSETKKAAVEMLPGGTQIEFVNNSERVPWSDFNKHVVAKVTAIAGSGTTLVKTEQLTAGTLALDIRKAIEQNQGRAAMLVRGGYLWSRYAAAESGYHSDEASVAAQNEASLCSEGDLVIGTTPGMVNDLCWRYRINISRTMTVPNFVIPPERVPTAEERDRNLIVTAGHIVAHKRFDILIESLAMLHDELRQSVRLELIGDGPDTAQIERLITETRVNASIIPTLSHDKMLQKFCTCAIYAQSSELEGHPKSVLDAMACGAVVVLAAAPGLDALVRTGGTGILVPNPSPAGFANAFTGILADADWCNLLGAAASQHACENFSIDKVIELELAACQKALANAALRRERTKAA